MLSDFLELRDDRDPAAPPSGARATPSFLRRGRE
jgi:hypothetical protein